MHEAGLQRGAPSARLLITLASIFPAKTTPDTARHAFAVAKRPPRHGQTRVFAHFSRRMTVSGRCGSRQIKFLKHTHPPDTTQTHTGNALWDRRVCDEFTGARLQIPTRECISASCFHPQSCDVGLPAQRRTRTVCACRAAEASVTPYEQAKVIR